MLQEMGEAELRVTLVMIRYTFGFHRDNFKKGIGKLAREAGLSRQGALTGAQEAEKRGTFRRTNPDKQGEAEWELVLDEPLQPVDTPLHVVEATPPATRGQSAVKEKIKKQKIKEGASAKPPTPPEVKLFRSVTRRYPHSANFEDVSKSIQAVGERLGREAVADDLLPFFKSWTSKGYNPLNLAWLEWAEAGQVPVNGTWKAQKYTDEPKGFQAVREFLTMNGVSGG